MQAESGMRIRYLLMLFVVLSWLWLVMHQNSPIQDSHATATQTYPHGAIDVDVEAIQADTAGLPHDTARRLYDRVMDEFARNDCAAARAGFHLFLELHPDSRLAPYAEYWLGECAFRQGLYRQAVISFDRVVAQYPISPKLAAAAFMRKGMTYAKLGEVERSRNVLELIVVQFPHTQQAAVARQVLLVPN
jgi:tol-pal system protein YbgF